MKLWLDAQLPPLLAGWIDAQGWGIQVFAVRDVGLRDASDPLIFRAAREAGVVVMTKDRDFIHPPAGSTGASATGDLAAPGELQQRCPAGGSRHHPAEGNGSSA